MTTAATWAIRLDKILDEAKHLTPARVGFTLVTFPFVLLGWALGLVWTVIALVWTAGVVGFREAKAVADRTPGE